MMVLNQDIFDCLFFRFGKKCIRPIKPFEKIDSCFCALSWIEFFLVLEFIQFIEDSCLYWSVILRLSRIFGCWELERAVLLLGFTRSEKFIQVGSQVRIALWNHTKDCHIYWFNVLGLLRSNHGEFCNLCVFFNVIW